MDRPITRVRPALPEPAMKTYAIYAPPATHWRAATCEEVGCQNWANGWLTVVNEATELGQRQAHYIRNLSGRAFIQSNEPGGTGFTFPAGQTCFQPHRVRLDRPEIYVVRRGDWRGQVGGQPRIHARPEDWVDDFATHQDQLATRLARG